jgi:hypothetical protein
MANNLFDTSKMVLLPSGAKAGKMYAQKPHTGDFDLIISRASTSIVIQDNEFKEIAANMPAIDFAYPDRPRYLNWRSSTNIITHMDNTTGWDTQGGQVSFARVAGAYGKLSRVTATLSGGATINFFGKSFSVGTTGQKVYSAIIDRNLTSTDWVVIQAASGTSGANANPTWFNLSTLTFGTTGTNNIVGFYKLTEDLILIYQSYNVTATGSISQYVTCASANNGFGTAGDVCVIAGVQYEDGFSATYPIYTEGTAVTRASETASKTGVSSYIKAPFSFVLRFDTKDLNKSGDRMLIDFYQDGNNYIRLLKNSNDAIRLLVVTGGSIVADMVDSTSGRAGNVIVSGRLATNNCALCVNGDVVAADLVAAMPAPTSLYLGTTNAGGVALDEGVSAVHLFDYGMTNAELEAIV